MRVTLLNPSFSNRNAGGNNAFRVLIVYEDYSAGRCAMDTYQHLFSQFGREFDFRISIWSFSVLQCAGLNEHAVHDAIEADAIILATHRRDDLPIEIKRWIENWVPQKCRQAAVFIALLDAGNSVIQPYLEKVSTRADMDFLMREIQSEKNSGRPRSAPPEPDDRVVFEGWGLND